MKNITLNEFIAGLQEIAKKHGDAELLSIGSCTGTFNGLKSPRSIHLKENGEEKTIYVPSYKSEENDGWKEGRIEVRGITFRYWAKIYEEGSKFGIDGGRISKLTIRNERTNVEVVNYDRGWDIEPKTKSAKEVLDMVLRNYN